MRVIVLVESEIKHKILHKNYSCMHDVKLVALFFEENKKSQHRNMEIKICKRNYTTFLRVLSFKDSESLYTLNAESGGI